ncbi:translation initiation factor IF-2 [Pelagibacterales bacterium]|nr:translation initiation factor IF-2 [Pelagibacterales bacterium]
MVEDKKNTTKKKTLSLKLGSSVKSNPLKSFESGSTVIVERKRLRKNVIASAEKIEPEKNQSPKLDEPEKKVETEVKEVKKSGKILKRLSKEEQKKLQEAKNAADKEDVLKEIGGIVNEQPQESKAEQSKATEESQEEIIKVVEEKDNKPVTTFKETELNEDQKDKKKPSGGYGRKNLRERKVTIVTALSGMDERTRSLAAYKRSKQKTKKNISNNDPQQKIIREVNIPEHVTVKELAIKMAEKSGDVIKSLMKMGMMATINETLDADTAELIVTEFGHKFKRENVEELEKDLISHNDNAAKDSIRPPIVTIMGHVDHGKTSLLDKLRNSNIVSGESGGITQHIGAYQIKHNDKKITFIDTPGHAAFTEMRARGANVTDIIILIVAADDGVMPQTQEAISHAKSANVPIIVAINKCDKPEANPKKIKEQLLSEEIIVEEFSGDVQCVEISAETGMNFDKLLESIVLQSELADLKANNETYAEGSVIEANVDKGRGVISNIIITNGCLKVGDIAVAGSEYGRVRAILDDQGKNLKEALPSSPIQMLGLGNAPLAGDSFVIVDTEKKALELINIRKEIYKTKTQPKSVKTFDNETAFNFASQSKELVEIVLKSDTRGSTEAIVNQINKILSDKVNINVIHSGVGLINESDVALAAASNALLVSFNTSATKEAKIKAKVNKTNIADFSIIYELITYVSDYATGQLKPEIKENYLGKAEILKVFKVSKVGSVAGCMVTDGMVEKDANARILRDDSSIYEGKIVTLMREKNEAKEVNTGTECGIGLKEFNEYKEGDIIEVFNVEEVSQTL